MLISWILSFYLKPERNVTNLRSDAARLRGYPYVPGSQEQAAVTRWCQRWCNAEKCLIGKIP